MNALGPIHHMRAVTRHSGAARRADPSTSMRSLLSEDLGHERTLWVRFSSSPEFFGTPKTNTALIEYVPSILANGNQEEMREKGTRRTCKTGPSGFSSCSPCLVKRPLWMRVGAFCGMRGTSEALVNTLPQKRLIYIRSKTVGMMADTRKAQLQHGIGCRGFLPEDLIVGGFVPSDGESKGRRGVVREAVGLPAALRRRPVGRSRRRWPVRWA